jgi:hypothetical protein
MGSYQHTDDSGFRYDREQDGWKIADVMLHSDDTLSADEDRFLAASAGDAPHAHTPACTSLTCYATYVELTAEPGTRAQTFDRWTTSNADTDAMFARGYRSEYAVYEDMAAFELEPTYSRFSSRYADRVHVAMSGRVVVKVRYM